MFDAFKNADAGQSFLDGLASEALFGADTAAAKPQSEKDQAAGWKWKDRDRCAPEPLRAPLDVAKEYPVDQLGAVLGNAAKALNQSVKAPLAMCCQSVLSAAAFSAQPHFDIKLPWGEVKPISLFFLTVGESGERKSGLDILVLGPAKAQERKDMECYLVELEKYELDKASWEQAVDAARKAVTTGKKGAATMEDVRNAVQNVGNKPESPVAPLRFVTDPTVEGLFKLLVMSQPSVAMFSDEAGLLIGGHALNSDNALKTFARLSKFWDGSPFDRVRAGDGASVLYGRRLALHQLAQPDVMIKLLSDPMANGQGFLARCLVAWPESTISSRLIENFTWAGELPEMKRLYAANKNLLETVPTTGKSAQELAPCVLEFSKEAIDLSVQAHNQFEFLMGRDQALGEIRDRAAKALEQACRIAAVLAVIENGVQLRLVEVEYLQRALVLIQWYLAEALRIRGAAAVPQSVSDAESLSRWAKERDIKIVGASQILQKGPNQLRNKTRMVSALSELVRCGYFVENAPGQMIDGVKTKKSWGVLHCVV